MYKDINKKRATALTYRHSEVGAIVRTYGQHRGRMRRRFGAEPPYDYTQLREWLYKNGYYAMWCQWTNSGHDKKLFPSCDRLNNREGYSLSNLRLVTWKENHQAARRQQSDGVLPSSRAMREVIGADHEGNVYRFPSLSKAGLAIGASGSEISAACRGKRGMVAGYKWRYADV